MPTCWPKLLPTSVGRTNMLAYFRQVFQPALITNTFLSFKPISSVIVAVIIAVYADKREMLMNNHKSPNSLPRKVFGVLSPYLNQMKTKEL